MLSLIRRLFLSAVPALLLAACAVTPPAPLAVETEAPPQDDLPVVALEPDVMYDILLGEIAAQRGQAAVATTTLARAAIKTRDPRLAERAALAAIYARRYGDALQAAQLWVELRPNATDAREALATALLELERPAEARVQLEKILALETARNNLDLAYLRAAVVLGRQTNRAAALVIMQSLVEINARTPAAHFSMAHLAVRLGDLDKADATIDRALELRPDWEEAALFKARILVSRKDMLKAQAFYEAFLDRHSGATNVRLNYARYLIDQKQWDKALRHFKRVAADTPDDAETMYAAGLLALQTNRLEEADKYLRRALELRPQNDQARLYLGQVAEQGKRYTEAVKWYGEVAPGENYFDAQARLGVVMARQGDLEAARRHLQGIQAQNDQQRVQQVLAEEQILRDARLYREALQVLNAALRVVPGDKDLLYSRALVADKLGDMALMEADLRSILKADPKHAHALNALGYALTDRTGRHQEALELLQQALALKPDDPYILDSMGWVHYRLGRNAESIKYLRRALEIRSDAEISAHLGEVLWVTGNRREAESIWDRALKDTPDNESLLGVINKFREKGKE